ncbi:hypothetical protein PFISCL1PPCAC_25502, partial [Pristionchus fissidentatus]
KMRSTFHISNGWGLERSSCCFCGCLTLKQCAFLHSLLLSVVLTASLVVSLLPPIPHEWNLARVIVFFIFSLSLLFSLLAAIGIHCHSAASLVPLIIVLVLLLTLSLTLIIVVSMMIAYGDSQVTSEIWPSMQSVIEGALSSEALHSFKYFIYGPSASYSLSSHRTSI